MATGTRALRPYPTKVRDVMARTVRALERAGSEGIDLHALMEAAGVDSPFAVNRAVQRLRSNRCTIEYDRANKLWRMTRRGPDALGGLRRTPAKAKSKPSGGARSLHSSAKLKVRRRAVLKGRQCTTPLTGREYRERRDVLEAFLANPDDRLAMLPLGGAHAPDEYRRHVPRVQPTRINTQPRLG